VANKAGDTACQPELLPKPDLRVMALLHQHKLLFKFSSDHYQPSTHHKFIPSLQPL
jgi:hypothetical protein